MSDQLDLVIKQSELAAKKASLLYEGLERLFRRSFMPPELSKNFPDLTFDESDYTAIPLSRNNCCFLITRDDHPLEGLGYFNYNTINDGKPKRCADFAGIYGEFYDPKEVVLRYLRKDLFNN